MGIRVREKERLDRGAAELMEGGKGWAGSAGAGGQAFHRDGGPTCTGRTWRTNSLRKSLDGE